MRRHFHDGRGHPTITHHAQQGVHLRRLRGGPNGRHRLTRDQVPGGPDDARDVTCRRQRGLEQETHGRLAIGTRDTYQQQLITGSAVGRADSSPTISRDRRP